MSRKYLIHFIYILVIVTLAVLSRMKTNELTGKLEDANNRVEEIYQRAQKHEVEATKQVARCVEAQAEAEKQFAEVLRLKKELEACQSK